MRAWVAFAVIIVGALSAWVAANEARAQVVPAAPTGIMLTATTNWLIVGWTAPASDGDSPIMSYDLHYIESAATDKADANWTLVTGVWSDGALSYTLAELLDGVAYDVRLRAVNSVGPGEWSATTSASTSDHGGADATATKLALGRSLPGRIDTGGDEDRFRIVLQEQTDLWLYTTGEADTAGELTSGGTLLHSNGDGQLPPNPRNFSLREVVDAGTYYVIVRGQQGAAPVDYRLHAVAVQAVGSSTPKTVELGSLTPARLVRRGWVDRFKIVLTEAIDVWVMSIGATDTVGELYDAADELIADSDDGSLPGNYLGFNLRAQVDAGTYYIRVEGFAAREDGPYILYTAAAGDPGDSIAAATPLTFDLPAAGRIEPAGDEDYFSLSVPTLAEVTLCALKFDRERFRLNMALSDADGNPVSISVNRGIGCGSYGLGPSSVASMIRLGAGVYHLRVTMSGDRTQAYTLVAQLDSETKDMERDCLSRGSSQSDPLYGCQWYLNNTGQFGRGAGQDINVEEIWATNKGAGVNVAVVDDGLQLDHEDLSANISLEGSHDYTPGTPWDSRTDWHATYVGGVIGARDNALGVRGIAPRATLYGFRALLGTGGDRIDALVHRMEEVAVSNHSYGFEDNGQYHYAGRAWEMAVERGVREGYGGKGVFYVWAAGNGSAFGDSANYDSKANHYGITAACAVDYLDTRSAYSELGANLWVCAPSSPGGFSFLPLITTTDNSNRYTHIFGGTSATAPIVAGVAALLRAAHPDLSWRDLKLILAGSARRNNPEHSHWEEGALQHGSTDERYWFSHSYGFGVVDAGAAMALADDWTSPPDFRELSATVNEQIVFGSGRTGSSSITLDPYVDFVEFIAVEPEISHSYYQRLRIKLTSPSGETSTLVFPITVRGEIEPWVKATPRFGSAKHLGESAAGEWTLEIVNEGAVGPATLHSWKLTVYGHGYRPGFAELAGSQPRDRAILVVWRTQVDSGATDVSSYDLRYRRSDAAGQAEGGEWTQRTGVWSSGSLSYELEGLAAGGRYELQLRAVNEAGAGPWSESLKAATTAVAPEAPTITQVEAGNAALKLNWTAPAHDGGAEITSYDVRAIETSADETVEANWSVSAGAWTSTSGELEHTLTGLSNGTQYDLQVRAVNDVGAGDWSATSTGTPRTLPGIPTVGTVSAGRRSLTVAWSAPADSGGSAITAYDLRQIRSDAGDKSDAHWTEHLGAWSSGSLEYTVTALADGVQYDVQVRARSDAGAGLWSASGQGTTLASQDATLSALVLSGVRLNEAFSSATTSYTASVGYTLERITVSPTTNEDQATLVYLDGNDIPLSDADPAGGFQVDLAVGQNVIQLKVTAQDGTTTRTYTVTLTRTAEDRSLSPPAGSDPSAPFASTATYSVRFQGQWRTAVTPGGVPGGAHFSRLIGGVHNAGVRFLESGRRASAAVESMAEVGGWTALRDEILNAAANALGVLVGETDNIGPTTAETLTAELASTHPRVTLTTMIAPSHDWFVGVSGLPLLNADGLWLRAHELQLYPWDAGTENGADFALEPSNETIPRGVITSIRGTGPFSTEPIAGLSFTLESLETERSLAENPTAVVELGPPIAPAASSGAVTYSLGGPDAGSFELDEATGRLRTKAGVSFDHEDKPSHTLSVTATDTDGAVVTTVHVDIVDQNEPPELSGPQAVEYEENDTTRVALYDADDPEEAPIEWSLDGTEARFFEISDAGELTFKEPPDHEARATYALTIRASDGVLADMLDVTVTVSDVDEPPEITPADDIVVDENHDGTLATFRARDPEGGATSWLALEGGDAGQFELSDAGLLRFTAVPDFESPTDGGRNNEYSVRLRASDGTKTGTLDLTVSVADVNEPPVISGEATVAFAELRTGTVARYSASDPEDRSVTWRPLEGTDRNEFRFDNGALSFAATPDFETPADANRNNEYSLRLRASDGPNSETFDVTVTVTNEDEDGTLSLSSQQPLVGTFLTATLTDPDRVSNESWSWQRSTNRSSWSEISGATANSYNPVETDLNHYLRATVDYTDGHGSGKRLQEATDAAVEPPPPVNYPPEFSDTSTTRSVAENSGEGVAVGEPVSATDDNDDPLTYSLTGGDVDFFTIDDSSGQIRVADGAMLDHEDANADSYFVTVTATDPSTDSGSIFVTITVTDVNERPIAVGDMPTTLEDMPVEIEVLLNDSDPEGDDLSIVSRTAPAHGTATIEADNTITYTPSLDYHGADRFTYTVFDGSFSDEGAVSVTIRPVNDAPVFAAATAERRVAPNAEAGTAVGAPVAATDVDGDTLTYSLSGLHAGSFVIDPDTGQITVRTGAVLDPETQATYTVRVTARDRDGATASVEVTITVAIPRPRATGGGGGGGGGPPPIPIPSDKDFEWNVTRDIEALDGGNDLPSGIWSDGRTLWVLENSATGPDRVFAYDLLSGERIAEFELELDRRNRFAHGIWSDGETVWIADSGQDQLFAYELESGERLEERDIELHEDNRDPRDIWSDGVVIYVLDSVKDALFVYDLETGELLAEYALDKLNQSPRGLWSDGVTLWVSDDGAKRLFAYEFDDGALTRNEDLEFTFRSLLKAGNGNPRGIWSDGDVIYVADEQDDRVYSYNIPDATIAQLASLSLSDIDIGEFAANRHDYAVSAQHDAAATTVAAQATQQAASVLIEPLDADGDAENGHQVTLSSETAIIITVTSADGSRTTTYRVQVSRPPCLEGLTDERLSEVRFAGGSLSELEACAGSLGIDAFYHHRDGVWTALFLFPGAPEFLSQPFRTRFPEGPPPGELLIANRGVALVTEAGTPNTN